MDVYVQRTRKRHYRSLGGHMDSNICHKLQGHKQAVSLKENIIAYMKALKRGNGKETHILKSVNCPFQSLLIMALHCHYAR